MDETYKTPSTETVEGRADIGAFISVAWSGLGESRRAGDAAFILLHWTVRGGGNWTLNARRQVSDLIEYVSRRIDLDLSVRKRRLDRLRHLQSLLAE